jgi:hypothetical protein
VVLPEHLNANVALAVPVAKKVIALIASCHCSPRRCVQTNPYRFLPALLRRGLLTPQTYSVDRLTDLPGHCCLTKPKYATASGCSYSQDKRSKSLSSVGF